MENKKDLLPAEQLCLLYKSLPAVCQMFVRLKKFSTARPAIHKKYKVIVVFCR